MPEDQAEFSVDEGEYVDFDSENQPEAEELWVIYN